MVSPYSLRWVLFGVLILTVFVMANEPGLNQDDLATRMRSINENLNRQLHDIMASQTIEFTMVNTTGLPYNATTKFNPKGMGQLYNVTNMFIDFIQSKQAFPKGMIKNDVANPRQLQFADPRKEWKNILSHYGGLTGLTVAGLICAAILPCVGLFFCCCRCAGRCGARTQPFDKKHDHCRKVLFSIMLIGVATIILFGVVCAFVTNEYMQEGIEELPNNVKVSLKDAELYLTTTKKQIITTLITNYNELEVTLNSILQASGQNITKQLAVYSHAISLTNLNDIVTGLGYIKQDLQLIDKITRDLRTNATTLDNAVRRVKLSLLETLKDCDTSSCRDVMKEYKVTEMSIQIDYDKLPNVSLTLRNITSLMEGDIVSEVSQGKKSFLKIQSDIQHAVNQTIPVVSESLKNAGRSLADVSNNITSYIDRLNSNINRVYIPNLKYAQDAINQYSMYRYYLGLGISGVLLIVLTCLTSGLFCGICGKRPDGYGDDCCNKDSGARFLMLAVWIIFLLMSVMMIVISAHMIVGVLTQRGVCEPLKNPEDNRMFEVIDNMVQANLLIDSKNSETDVNLTWILTKCHANETIYKVLKLEHVINVESFRSYIERYAISNTVDQLRKMINLSPGIVILTESATSKLNDLVESGLDDIKYYQYAELLKDNITNINLSRLGIKLREVAAQLPSNLGDIRKRLINNADSLEKHHRDLVVPMTTLSEQLSESALMLEKHIKFNHSSMAEAIDNLVKEVLAAQDFLNKDGAKYVEELATKFGDAFLHRVSDFLEHVISAALNEIGKCGPLSNAYNATVTAGCNRILDPFNGFWTSVGWCLIMFIPTIILCVKLSALYQKSDPYPGPLVETVHDKKHSGHSRHLPNAYVESYDGPAGTTAAYSGRERIVDVHQGSSHNDSRYSDHAPKNWDFPNGGPPRYQPPPGAPPLSTEYERPPPYYYPGPGDRN